MLPCTWCGVFDQDAVPKRDAGFAFSFRSSMKTGRMHEKNVAMRGYCHEFVFCGYARAVNVNNRKIPASRTGKPMTSGKAYGAAIIVAHFAFSCTLLGEFAALISEKQNWRKLIYENRNACVGCDLDIGRKYFGERSGK